MEQATTNLLNKGVGVIIAMIHNDYPEVKPRPQEPSDPFSFSAMFCSLLAAVKAHSFPPEKPTFTKEELENQVADVDICLDYVCNIATGYRTEHITLVEAQADIVEAELRILKHLLLSKKDCTIKTRD